MLGPYISASNKPVFNPNLANEHAIFTAIVLLPTPPLPLLTAIICLIPSIFFKSGPGKVGIFSTEFLLPSNSYQGKYYVRYFIFQNGEFLSYAENKIDLKQAGFNRIISLTATNFPLLYGILAVILSGSLGWLISTIFRRLKIS